jgi:hypothetical protein
MSRIILATFLALFPIGSVSASDFATDIIAATFKFFHPDCTSTCFLVRREDPDKALYLVTTAHSMEGTKGETAVLVLRERKPDGTHARRDHPVVIRQADKPLWVRHAKEDVAVLRLAEPLPLPVPGLPLAALADEDRMKQEGLNTCSQVFVLTYPQRFEANSAGFPVARQGIIADHPFLPIQPHHRFLADFTTFAGDSGGPVFVCAKDQRPLVIGIVLGQFHHEERVNTAYEERILRHPLGLGTVLYSPFVRDTIEQAVKQ